MIEKTSLIESYQKIIRNFGQQEYFGKVHSLETPSEGLCSFYYVELKPPFPKTKTLQYGILWKLLELNESQDDYRGKTSTLKEEILREQFQYTLDSWEPRSLEEKEVLRAREIMLECQASVEDHSSQKAWMTRRQAGYYMNNKFKSSIFPADLFEKITNNKNTGITVYDEWNEFVILIETKKVLSMFYWTTYA